MPSEKLYSLQILRAAAATAVVVSHAVTVDGFDPAIPVHYSPYAFLGAFGVDIFFVLSGAIIYLIAFAGQPMSPSDFMWRRFIRIAPIFWLATLALLPLGTVNDSIDSATSILATFTFWPAWGRIEGPALKAGWTLCYEMLFYVLAAIILVRRDAKWWIAAGYACCCAMLFTTGWPVFRFLGNPIIVEFGAGIAVAALWSRRKRAFPAYLGVGLVLSGIFWLVTFVPPQPIMEARWTLDGALSAPRVLCWGVPAVMLLLGALTLEPYLRWRWLRGAVFLGDASYAIYLVHLPLVEAAAWGLRASGFDIPIYIRSMGLIALGIGAGVLVYQHVERPLLRFLRNGPLSARTRREVPALSVRRGLRQVHAADD